MEAKQNAAETGMLVRKPVSEVFNAFIDPEITTKFWFTKSTGKLEAGKEVTWSWEMYGVSDIVIPKEIVANKKIVIEWGAGGEMSRVEWTFTVMSPQATFVSITNDGFTGDPESIQQKAKDSQGGFSLVLAGLKAWLEFGIQLNLVADRFPGGKP